MTKKKIDNPPCFGTESCGTEEYEGCPVGDECSFEHKKREVK